MYQSPVDLKSNKPGESPHDLYAQPIKKKTKALADPGDIYAVVDKKNKQKGK